MNAPNAPNPANPNTQNTVDQNQDQNQGSESGSESRSSPCRSGPSSCTCPTSTTTGPSTTGSCWCHARSSDYLLNLDRKETGIFR